MDAARTPTVETLLAERAWLRRLAGALVSNATDADDLTQDTLVAAIERAPAHVERPRGWLATVARNLARNRFRSESRRRAREESVAQAPARGTPSPSPDELVARAELVERVARLVLTLEEPYRSTVLRRFFEDEKPAQIAARTGVPVETVRTRLRRALAVLAERLDAERGGRAAWAPALALWHVRARGGGATGAGTAAAATTVAPAGIAGALAMKKLAIAIAALLLVLVGVGVQQGWWIAPPASDDDAPRPLASGDAATSPMGALAAAPTDAGRRDAKPVARGPARLRGVVIDGAGRPAAGIPVRARTSPGRLYLPFEKAPPLGTAVEDGAVLATATSSADGTFELTGLAYHEDVELEAAPSPPLHGSRALAKAIPWIESHFVLRVGAATALRGRVVDARERGVAAWVEAHEDSSFSSGNASSLAGRWKAPLAATDAEGRFAFDAVPKGTLLLSAIVPGRVARYAVPVVASPGVEVRLRLDEPGGASVAGTTHDEDGAPIVGAAVVVTSRSSLNTPMPVLLKVGATTGADGRYRVEGLLAGAIQSVEVTAPGFVAPMDMLGYELPLRAGETTTFNIALGREMVAEGVVVAEDGTPIENVDVAAKPRLSDFDLRGRRLTWATRSGADGRFRLGGLPLVETALTASAAGYAPGSADAHRPATGRTVRDIRLVLRREAAGATTDLRGVAVGPDEKPVAASSVTASPATGEPRYASVADDGSFVVKGIDVSGGWRLMANAPDWSSEAVEIPASGPIPARYRLVLRPVRRIVGRVVGPDGLGVPDLTVRANEEQDGRAEASTALDGGFVLSPLTPGTWTVAALDAVGERGGDSATVALTESDTTSTVTLRVRALRILGGTVVDEDGRPVEGRQVKLGAWSDAGPYTYSDAAGRFALSTFAPGPFALAVDSTTVPGSFAPDRADHRLVWKRRDRQGTEVEIVVLAPDGRPAETGQVTVWSGQLGSTDQRSSGAGARGSGGVFRVRLEPGEQDFDVEVSAVFDAAGRRIDAKPTIVKDLRVEQSPVTIRLEPGRSVRILVVDADGKPLPGVDLLAGPSTGRGAPLMWQGSPSEAYRGTTDSAGRFLAVGLPDAAARLLVRPPSGYVEPSPIDLGPEEEEVTVRLERGRALAGVVVDADGKPVRGANVRVSVGRDDESMFGDPSHRPGFVRQGWDAAVDPRGAFRVDGLPAGLRYTVQASGPSPLVPTTLTGVAAGRDDVRLRLDVGRFVEGTIVGSGWGAKQGLTVYLEDSDADPMRPKPHVADARVPPGATTFRVGPAAPGTYRLVVDDRDLSWSRLAVVDSVDAPSSDVSVTLPVVRHVVGRVTNFASDDDVRRFHLNVLFADGNGLGTGLDAGGGFRVGNIREGAVSVLVWRDGDERIGFADRVDPAAGPIELTLKPGLTIEGRIDLPTPPGKPFDVGANGSLGMRRVTADAEGRFRFVGLPPGSSWLIATYGGFTQAARDVAAGTRDLVLHGKVK